MIKNKKKDDQIFSFGPVTYDDVLKTTTTPKKQEKITLGTAKAKVSQLSDIPTKTLKRKSDYFAEYIYKNINQCFSKSIFPIVFEISWRTRVYKKELEDPNITIGHVAYYPLFPKFTKNVSMIKFSSIWILYCPNIGTGLVEITTPNAAW